MRSLPVCAALALAVAGCGDASAPSDSADPAIRIENPGSDRLKALTPLNQRIGLMRAIRANGKRCRGVERGAYQQEYQGMAMWVALCRDGRHWAVYIAPNEDVQVRDCSEAEQLGLPLCRPIPPMPADPTAPPSTQGNATTGNAT
jgi:hypothetical protein